MNRPLAAINTIGIIAVGVLCVLQWKQISRMSADAVIATRHAADQEAAIAKQKRLCAVADQDLADVRNRLAAAQSAADGARVRAETAGRNVIALSATIERYKFAVAERDSVLAKQAVAVKSMAAERNDYADKFNDLVTKYNKLVGGEPAK